VIEVWRIIRHARDDKGAAAVEFALVLPILVLLLFGMIEFGVVYDAQLQVTHAAREGARRAAVGGNMAAVQAVVDAQTTGLGSSKALLVAPTVVPPAPPIQDATLGDHYVVTVQYVYKLDIPLWGERDLLLKSTAQMRKE